MRWILLCWIGCAAAGMAADVTMVELTGKVVVADISRLGINLGGDSIWSGAILRKKRVEENFEGSLYRQCHSGELFEDGYATSTAPLAGWKRTQQMDHWKGAELIIISGGNKWQKRTVTEVTTRKIFPYSSTAKPVESIFFVFDEPVDISGKKEITAAMDAATRRKAFIVDPTRGVGALLQKLATDEGFYGMNPGVQVKGIKVSIGDVAEESFGQAAALMDGTKVMSWILGNQRYGNVNGTWHVHFRAKAKLGSPRLTIVPSHGSRETINLDDEWEKFEVQIKVSGVPEPEGPEDKPQLSIDFQSGGGQVLVDDVEIWMEGDENPTAFRDDVVNALKRYNPGVLRKLQMGGNTIESTIRPNLSSYRFQSSVFGWVGPLKQRNSKPYGLHEFYELCEHIDSEPWYCVPGTLTKKEVTFLMEYLGGPESAPGGQLRTELGHPEPWTKTFKNIHVEFGNEAWNGAGPFKGGGFNGPDYWNDLIAEGKASKHYEPNVLFHTAGQNFASGKSAQILRDAPNSDRHAIAPYMIQQFTPENAAHNDTPEKFFRWAFGFPIEVVKDRPDGMKQQGAVMEKTGVEFSIYEINYHITHGTGPVAPRNMLTAGIAGGVNMCNTMLMLLEEYGIRTQCLFNFLQYSYGHSPDLKAKNESVRLWGTAISTKAGSERFRPTWLASEMANHVLGGDLVETVHSGAQPRATGSGPYDRSGKTARMIDYEYDEIHSYGVVDGKRRGLILMNLSVDTPHEVKANFSGAVDGGATRWVLTGESLGANNDYENDKPQVAIKEDRLDEFKRGTLLSLPPYSMVVLQWHIK